MSLIPGWITLQKTERRRRRRADRSNERVIGEWWSLKADTALPMFILTISCFLLGWGRWYPVCFTVDYGFITLCSRTLSVLFLLPLLLYWIFISHTQKERYWRGEIGLRNSRVSIISNQVMLFTIYIALSCLSLITYEATGFLISDTVIKLNETKPMIGAFPSNWNHKPTEESCYPTIHTQ